MRAENSPFYEDLVDNSELYPVGSQLGVSCCGVGITDTGLCVECGEHC